MSISFSISELVYSNTVKNNLLSTDQGQKAKLGSFKALNVFAILQIIVGVGAILSYAANVIA
ncbi:MAG: hypothetical protein HUJ68_06480 [Clostridia bacterium]|nr:hypothetical protein [Clostridia bacterium]